MSSVKDSTTRLKSISYLLSHTVLVQLLVAMHAQEPWEMPNPTVQTEPTSRQQQHNEQQCDVHKVDNLVLVCDVFSLLFEPRTHQTTVYTLQIAVVRADTAYNRVPLHYMYRIDKNYQYKHCLTLQTAQTAASR
jgi:hypothetical protein